jgi:hypothetical protein
MQKPALTCSDNIKDSINATFIPFRGHMTSPIWENSVPYEELPVGVFVVEIIFHLGRKKTLYASHTALLMDMQ